MVGTEIVSDQGLIAAMAFDLHRPDRRLKLDDAMLKSLNDLGRIVEPLMVESIARTDPAGIAHHAEAF